MEELNKNHVERFYTRTSITDRYVPVDMFLYNKIPIAPYNIPL